MVKKQVLSIMVLLILCLLLPVNIAAMEGSKLTVAVNQSQVLTFAGVQKVAVANPDIADVLVVSGSEVLVVGKAPGSTTLFVWSGGSRICYDIEVGNNDTLIASEIKTILGYPDIQVSKVDKSIILEGKVNDQYQKMRAEKVASAYAEKVINLLELTRPIQVKIEARIIEIDRSKTDKLGIKWGNSTSSPGSFQFGQSPQTDWKMTYPGTNGATGNSYNNALGDSKYNGFGKSWGGFGGYADINAQLDALLQHGFAKILSQPNMITLSGEKASILVGGEIPVPISVQSGTISVEWKEYGIKLEISPEVNGEGLISSKVNAEVSTLDWSSDHKIGLSADFQIPTVLTRKAETVLALSSGQTMAIGGLMSSNETRSLTKIPFLSSLPVIGKLFTSKSFTRDETELIILITPTVINPENYVPDETKELQGAVKENPWGVKENDGKN